MSKARLVITAVNIEKRPVSEVARGYGVARSWIYTLLARYAAEGEAAFEPRSRRPGTSPRAIPDAAVSLIIELRKDLAGHGLDAGLHTIAWHLEHHHHHTRVSAATVSRYLTRAGLVTPSRASARSRLTSGSPPTCRTSAGRPTSPATRSPAGPAPRSWPGSMTTPGMCCPSPRITGSPAPPWSARYAPPLPPGPGRGAVGRHEASSWSLMMAGW